MVKFNLLREIRELKNQLPLNRYGELAVSRVIGVEWENVLHVTRWHSWKVEKRIDTDLSKGCMVSHTTISSDRELMPQLEDYRRQAVQPACTRHQDSLTATVTDYGERLTRIPAGTSLNWPEAKSLPPGEPGKPVAIWKIGRHGDSFAPWSSVNNCTHDSEFHPTSMQEC